MVCYIRAGDAFAHAVHCLLTKKSLFKPIRGCQLKLQNLECSDSKPDVNISVSKRGIFFGGSQYEYITVHCFLRGCHNGEEISLRGMSYRVGKYLLLRQYIDFLPIRACHSRQHIFDCKSGKPHVTRCEYKRGVHFVVCRIRVAGYEAISPCLPQNSTQHSVNEGIEDHMTTFA